MDFFAQQEKARKKTKLLIFYFAVAVTLLIAMMYFVVLFGFFYTQISSHHRYDQTSEQFNLWNQNVFFGATIITLAIITIGCAYKINELSGGGPTLAASLGGRLVPTNTTELDERKLLNVVEEMAIASGVPVPQVYVLDDEKGINAFAAGHSTSDAVVAVTYGAMKLLSRDELQGVMGHEFSHILNGDMKLNLRLIGILFGILCLATVGRILLRTRGRKNPLPLLGLVMIILGSVGVFFGRLIQAAISRQREFLADASSVQFTRNPSGLSGALQKIGGYGFSSWITSAQAPDAGHLFFGNGNPRPFFNMMSTHPPLAERIRAIDSTWDGNFARVDHKALDADYAKRPHEPRSFFLNDKMIILGGAIAAGEKSRAIKTNSVLPNLGNPRPMHLEYAEKFRAALPENIKAAAREPFNAVALIYAMLLSCDESMRATQLAELAKRVDPTIQQKVAEIFPDVSKAATHAYLPMVNLALGALKQLSAAQFENFSQTLRWLVNSDGKIELFEFALQKIVLHHLAPQFGKAQRPVVQYYTIKPLVPECVLLLSALANIGSSDTNEIQNAFNQGAPYLRAPDDCNLQLIPREQCGVNQVDAALNRVMLVSPIIKKNLIDACAHVVGADGNIQENEAELLRAIAETLDCPIPPFVPAE